MAPRATETARARGAAVEALAERHLTSAGLRPVERNYHCPAGEIDLVMRERDTLVFVEVRARRSGAFGSAAESIDARKRRRLLATAEHYLQSRRHRGPVRFDVVALTGTQLDWLPNAIAFE
jgi:putative endonuclease